jgi:site-specific DNA-methyltransferase (adenine-specific)
MSGETAAFGIDCGDAVQWLIGLRSESVDLVVTDPAYESLQRHRIRVDAQGVTRHRGRVPRLVRWFPIFSNGRFGVLFSELFRVLKWGRHCYVFCDVETMFVAKPAAEAAGFKFWNALVWDKQRIGMGYHYRHSHEVVLFLAKEKASRRRKLRDLGIGDVIQCRPVIGGYPTEKPEAVSSLLIKQSTEPGELVIDPFVGSGSIGGAALKLGRSFAGCDVDSEACALARARLGSLFVGAA